MTHAQIELGFKLAIYGWLPFCFLVFIYLLYCVYKKIAQKRWILEATLADKNKIALATLWYSLPAIVTLVIMVIPAIYFNHLVKQEDYCLTIIKVNKINTIENPFLQDRCSSFDLPELIERTKPN
ncbi:hypothetical protein [Neisseria sp. Ec49-e6-T10]|uniref:hypothetical protein n=1 Tax=Neisseria sp. Ec49-e6-T10 TaxID=3140744 RepID=UPI003EB85E01